MADEIAQVCELEIEGVKLVVKGGVQVASWIMQAMKSLLTMQKEHALEKGGTKDLAEIWKLSKDDQPKVIDVPMEHYEAILTIAKNQGLRFYAVPDLIPTDNKLPVCLPPQDVSLFAAIVSSFLANDITESEKIINGYNTRIDEIRERRINATPNERLLMDVEIDHLEQAREELLSLVNEDKAFAEGGGVIPFTAYLAKGIGTEFEKDPEKAIAEYEKGVEIGRVFTASECMQPIRERRMLPKSMLCFYVPETGATITRDFLTDKESGLSYSAYTVKNKDGELYEFSDRGISKSAWNEKVLPNLLDKCGILPETGIRTFDSREKYQNFLKYHDNVLLKSEENLMLRSEEEKKSFSAAGALDEIKQAVANMTKARASADERITITLPKEDLILKNGKLTYTDGLGAEYEFKGITPGEVKDETISFSIRKEEKVAVSEGLHLRIVSAIDARNELEAVKDVVLTSRINKR